MFTEKKSLLLLKNAILLSRKIFGSETPDSLWEIIDQLNGDYSEDKICDLFQKWIDSVNSMEDVYELTIEYMIGDADGYDSKMEYISLNNPFIDDFVRIAENIRSFDSQDIEKAINKGKITKADHELLRKIRWGEGFSSEIEKEFAAEIKDIIIDETDLGWFTIEDVYLSRTKRQE